MNKDISLHEVIQKFMEWMDQNFIYNNRKISYLRKEHQPTQIPLPFKFNVNRKDFSSAQEMIVFNAIEAGRGLEDERHKKLIRELSEKFYQIFHKSDGMEWKVLPNEEYENETDPDKILSWDLILTNAIPVDTETGAEDWLVGTFSSYNVALLIKFLLEQYEGDIKRYEEESKDLSHGKN